MKHPDEEAEGHRQGSTDMCNHMDYSFYPGQSSSPTTKAWLSSAHIPTALSMEGLSTAMSRLSAKDTPITWNFSAFGTPARALDNSTIQVQIRWKPILMDVVKSLGGTEPVYTRHETVDGLFQVRLKFDLFLSDSRGTVKHVDVIGMKQPTLLGAENEASAAALQEVQLGCLNMRIIDVSRNYCKEMEKRWQNTLVNATSLYDRVKQVLLDYENFMQNAETYYRPSHQKAVESKCHTMFRINVGIRSDVADQLFILMRVNYLELKGLISKIEESKTCIESVYQNGKQFFSEPLADKTNTHRGALPKETEICMKVVLDEMMLALGWVNPTFSISGLSSGLYVCQTSLLSNNSHVCTEPRILTIFGDEAVSPHAAVESSCKAAISALEAEMSICVLDLNYYQRSAAQHHMVKGEEAVKSVTYVSEKVLAQWEAMASGIQTCQQLCLNVTGEQKARHEGTFLYKINQNTVNAVSELHEICLAGFLCAKDRLNTGLQ